MSAPLMIVKETIHANDIPRLITDDIVDYLWTNAQKLAKNAEDRILIRRSTISHQQKNYTIDYITTQILGIWHQYKVIYPEDASSPFPHTVDFRFEAMPVAPLAVASSSSSFRAAAYAKMNM